MTIRCRLIISKSAKTLHSQPTKVAKRSFGLMRLTKRNCYTIVLIKVGHSQYCFFTSRTFVLRSAAWWKLSKVSIRVFRNLTKNELVKTSAIDIFCKKAPKMKDKVSEESKVNCDFFSKNTTNLVFGETLEKVEIYLLFSFSLAINFQTCRCTVSSLAWTRSYPYPGSG